MEQGTNVTDAIITEVAENPDALRRVLEAAGLMTMDAVASRIGISYYRVKMLRSKRTKIDTHGQRAGQRAMPRSDALPSALPLPGDPLWHPKDIETWGRQTGRLDPDGNPKRVRPTGRPRRPRSAKPTEVEAA
jgi:hypothetical protein